MGTYLSRKAPTDFAEEAKLFWHSGAVAPGYFRQLVNYLRIEAEEEGTEELRESMGVYSEIWRRVERRRIEGAVRQKESRPGLQLYPVQYDPGAHFRIVGLAPSANQCASYLRGVLECFSQDGGFKERLPREHDNKVSVALLVIFGSTRLVLGGDVETEGWLDALVEYPPTALAASLVKVSHHGSGNGYCDGLWAHLAATGRPSAVITSYLSQGLPRRQTIEHIRDHGCPVLLTCGTAVRETELSIDLDPRVLRSRLALLTKMGRLDDEARHSCGRWTFVFDDKGNCLERDAAAPAVDLAEVLA